MIDPSVLKDTWGYASEIPARQSYGVQPGGQGKTSVTRKDGQATTTPIGQTYKIPTGGGNEMANFQFPTEWTGAGNTWSQMASGNYSNAGMDYLKNLMGSGGNAFDVSGWDQMYRPAMMDQYSNMVKEMAEQAGVGGTRYGSGLQGQIANYGGQLQNKYTQDLWDRMFGAYEAGQGRAAGAGNLMSQLGLGASQTGAEGLLSLGQNKSQLPLNVASMMSGIGQGMTGQQVDPWTQMMASLLGGTGYAQPQTYTPSGFQSMLSSLAQTLPAGLEAWDKQGWW